jgi:DNA-binding LacI/PurR family transcriptional regulator
MGKLGYVPREVGVERSSVDVKTIALFVPLRVGIDRGVMMRFVSAINESARLRGCNVLLFTDCSVGRDVENMLSSGLADASILMDVEMNDPRVSSLLSANHPTVLVGLPGRIAGLYCVDLNFSVAGTLAVDYMAALGHREIGLLGSPREVYRRGTSYAQRLVEGFQNGVRSRRLQSHWLPCEIGVDSVAKALDTLFRHLPGMTGLIVHNEAALAVSLLELKRRGLHVSRDMHVVSVGNEDCLPSDATLSASVALPISEIGHAAVDMALAQVADRAEPEVRLISPRLVTRDGSEFGGITASARRVAAVTGH